MAEHDFNIANAAAATVRADINSAFAAIVSQNSKATAPTSTFAHMWWYDTTSNILKMRNTADDAWINLIHLDQTGDLAMPDFNGLSFSQGDIIYFNGTQWAKLAIGTAAQALVVNTGATALEWGTGSIVPSKQIFTASGTWTRPSGCRYVKVSVTGGGGGGGHSGATGKGGATAIRWIDVTALGSSTITIGAGGAGVNSAGPSAGGDSIWSDGAHTVTGKGGPAINWALATGGDINLQAKDYSSIWGPGGSDGTSPTDAINPGSGGGAHTSVSNPGADGADGIIVVEEFY